MSKLKKEIVESKTTKIYDESENEEEKSVSGYIEKTILFSTKNLEKRLVYGIVLEPEKVDLQGDIYDADTIELSAHKFLKDVRQMGVMHKQFGNDLHVVESYIAPVNFEMDGQKVDKGTWILGAKVVSDELWEAIKNEVILGFSIGYRARYLPLEE